MNLTASIDTLLGLLRQERAAVAALDSEAVAALSFQKQEQFEALSRHLRGLTREVVSHHKTALIHLRAAAEANALLLRDAVELVEARLGPRSSGLYDARGGLTRAGPQARARI